MKGLTDERHKDFDILVVRGKQDEGVREVKGVIPGEEELRNEWRTTNYEQGNICRAIKPIDDGRLK